MERSIVYLPNISPSSPVFIPARPFSYLSQDTDGINAMLNNNDVSEYLKIGPDGLEVLGTNH